MVKQRGQPDVQHPECVNDTFITISCCQMLFAFLSRSVCADEQLLWEDISLQGCASSTAAGQVWVWQQDMAMGRSSGGSSKHTRVEGEGHPVCNGFGPLHHLGTFQRTGVVRASDSGRISGTFCLPKLMLA